MRGQHGLVRWGMEADPTAVTVLTPPFRNGSPKGGGEHDESEMVLLVPRETQPSGYLREL